MYIRKLKSGKWYVEINKKGFPRLQKSFLDKPTARNWAREIELQMDKNIFEDYSGAIEDYKKALKDHPFLLNQYKSKALMVCKVVRKAEDLGIDVGELIKACD